MMRILIMVGAGLVALAVLVTLAGAAMPADWRIERTAVIRAPAASVYPLLASFRTGWSRWNPWLEPAMQIRYEGPDAGLGATQRWTGGTTDGGSIRLTAADADAGVSYALMFGSFPINGRIQLAARSDGGTDVHWMTSGRISGFPAFRLMRFGLERFVGKPMDRGLAAMQASLLEANARHVDAGGVAHR